VDCEKLNLASEHLAAIAATIKATKANYVPSCIALLIEVNDIVLAVRDRGLRRIQMYLERQQDSLDADARAKQRAADTAAGEQPLLPGWGASDHDSAE